MESDKVSILHRLYGDASNVTSRFEDILLKLRRPTATEDEKEILWHLRRIVDTCDKISSEVESTFRDEIPTEI